MYTKQNGARDAFPVPSVLYAARARRAEAALDAMAAPALIVTGTGELLHRNRAATLILRRQDGILVRHRRLCAIDPGVQWKLQALLAAAGRRGRRGRRIQHAGVLGVPRLADKCMLQLVVMPLRPARRPSSQVLVLVGDPGHSGTMPASALTTLYGLTGTEEQIARRLLLGRSIAQIATDRCVTPGTLRGQLKSIFRKTRTGGQSELVKLLLSVPRVL